MAIEVFNRYEKKYMLDEETFERIRKLLGKYTAPDAYNIGGKPYAISNIYYDTEDYHFIRTSLQKPAYKEKLRLRAYGVPDEEDLVFMEIKKKAGGLVNKRRTSLHLQEAYEFMDTGEIPERKPYMNEQVLRELAYIRQNYALRPKVYIAYDRIACFSTTDSDLRISFDTNIRYRTEDLRLEHGDFGAAILPEGKWLMEIKTRGAFPLPIAMALSEYEIYPTSFSKYGYIYGKLLEGRERRQRTYSIQKDAVVCGNLVAAVK